MRQNLIRIMFGIVFIGLVSFVMVIGLGDHKNIVQAREVLKLYTGKYLKDQQYGLPHSFNSLYLNNLRTKYSDSVPLPDFIDLESGRVSIGCIGQCSQQEIESNTISIKAFSIARTETSVEQWDACVAAGHCNHLPYNFRWGRGNLPVLNVSWNEVQIYIDWLNKNTSGGYRLPTNHEWEYAARAGTNSQYPWEDQALDCERVRFGSPSWKSPTKHDCQIVGTRPVDSGEENPWGLKHILGNVAEWVSDCQVGNELQIAGEQCLLARSNRGASWCTEATGVSVLHRRNYFKHLRYNRVGFRLARDI